LCQETFIVLREFIYDHFRLIAQKSRMTSIPIISAYYLNPIFELIDSYTLGLDRCNDSLLPNEIRKKPFLFVPHFAAYEMFRSLVRRNGIEHVIYLFNSLSADEVFHDLKRFIAKSVPCQLRDILKDWMSLLRRSNHEQIQLVKESGSYWLKITTCKHEKDTFIQDLFEISWFRLAIGALAPRFIPDRCRIRASSSRGRRAWLRQHIGPLVECGQKFISIEVPEETLKSIVSIENKDAPPLDSLLRPPPISYLETIVEILCAYFPNRWLTIEELAGVINSSPRTIQRRLLAEGTNFRDLMIQTKMSLAKKALLETDSSITQIAMDFGFSASSSFTRSFVGHYGISPTEFRRHPRTTKKP
jgi:AraC-like DNA-binding protein